MLIDIEHFQRSKEEILDPSGHLCHEGFGAFGVRCAYGYGAYR
jgi:hypothetical protein